MYFLVNLKRGGTPPLCRSTSILKELFDSTPQSRPRFDPEIALNQGRIAFKSAVDLHPRSSLPDRGFYSLLNTPNRLAGWPTLSPGFGEAWGSRTHCRHGSIHWLRIVKEPVFFPPGRTGILSIVSYFIRLYKTKKLALENAIKARPKPHDLFGLERGSIPVDVN
jgi:hypothetical protein